MLMLLAGGSILAPGKARGSASKTDFAFPPAGHEFRNAKTAGNYLLYAPGVGPPELFCHAELKE
jgi:hypothetical protein